MNKAAQARAGIIKMIAEDSTIITINRYPQMSDGFGGYIDDTSKTPVAHKYRVGISHEKSTVASPSSTSIGISTNLKKMITMDYHGGPLEGEMFTINSKKFKIGAIDALTEDGMIIGYQAPLLESGT